MEGGEIILRKYGFSNGNGCSLDYRLKFLSFPVFSYGQEIVESTSIPGRVGTITKRTGQYTDTVISNSLEFEAETISTFDRDEKTIRAWLQSSTKLVYSDMEDKFFVVKKVEIGDVKRKYSVYGEIEVVFTCEPSTYLKDGQEEIDVGNFYNLYSWSQPIYKLSGSGTCTLMVNGSIMTADVVDNLIIDTERMIAYKSNGTLANTAVKGDYEDLYLQPGENAVSVSSGFECKIIPNWRCL
jgi:phage-related protein